MIVLATSLLSSGVHAYNDSQQTPIVSATIRAAVSPGRIVVLIRNKLGVPLDAWAFVVTYRTASGESRQVQIRNDFFQYAVIGDKAGEGAIQPSEERLETIDEAEANSLIAADLQLLIFRDMRFEGDPTHLIVTPQIVPDLATQMERYFLVLLDGVPGGTGYLKTLYQHKDAIGREGFSRNCSTG